MDEFIAGFKAGDESAVRAVYRQYGGAITTVARSMVSEPELVEEIVQQTFVKAWRAASTFDTDRAFAPWLYAIARRTAIDTLRRERKSTTGDHEPEADLAVETLSFDRTWEVFEVRRAIDALPPDERDVVKMSHLLGLTHVQIAEHLDVPVGTVKSRSGRAHRRLAVALGHLSPAANQAGVSDVGTGDDQ